MNTATSESSVGFEYVDLNEIDPTFRPIPGGEFYTFKILKAELRHFAYKEGNQKGVPAGTPDSFVKFNLAVTDHPEFAGRRIFPTLFSGPSALKKLRRVMDATGIAQEPGTPLDAWLATLSEQQPTLRLKAIERPDRRDPNTIDNDVDWWSAAPVIE